MNLEPMKSGRFRIPIYLQYVLNQSLHSSGMYVRTELCRPSSRTIRDNYTIINSSHNVHITNDNISRYDMI